MAAVKRRARALGRQTHSAPCLGVKMPTCPSGRSLGVAWTLTPPSVGLRVTATVVQFLTGYNADVGQNQEHSE